MRTGPIIAPFLVAGLMLSCRSTSAGQPPTLPIPTNCPQLDQQLEVADGLGPFLMHGLKETTTAVEAMGPAESCIRIAKTADYVGGLVGIASYCDAQSVLRTGASGSPIYKRLGTVLRLMSNDLHALSDKKQCWKNR